MGSISQILFVGDIMFTYAVETYRIVTNTTYGFEISLRLADPNRSDNSYIFYFLALATLISAYLTDNYLGKMVVTLLSISFALVSSLSLLFDTVGKMKSMDKRITDVIRNVGKVSFHGYICSSAARNIIYLEQIPLPEEMQRLRRYVFYLVYTRLLIRTCVHVAYDFQLYTNLEYFLIISLAVAVSFIIIYILLLLCFIRKVYWSPRYGGIWGKCIACLIIALKGSTHMGEPAGLSPKTRLKVTHGKPKHAKTLPRYSTMTKVKRKVHKIKEGSARPIDKAEDISHIDTTIGAGRKAIHVRAQFEKEHWLQKASPECSDFVIMESIHLFEVTLILIPGFCYAMGSYYALETSMSHAVLTVNPIPSTRRSEFTNYVLGFDILLFPMCEYIIFPYLRKLNITDIHNIVLSTFFLCIAAYITLIVNIHLEQSLQYSPEPLTSRIRFYNSLPFTLKVSSYWIGTKKIKPFHTFLQFQVLEHSMDITHPVRITYGIGRYEDFIANLYEKETVSYVITNDSLVNCGIHEPSIQDSFSKNVTDSIYIIIHEKELHGTLQFYDRKTGIIKEERLTRKGLLHMIDAGVYNITYLTEEGNLSIIYETFHLRSSTIYAMFLYRNESIMHGKIIKLEGPIPELVYASLFEAFFISLSNAWGTVSFFKFIFMDSPVTLKATILSLHYVLSFVGIGTILGDTFQIWNQRHSNVLWTVVGIQCVGLIATIIIMAMYTPKHNRKHYL